MLRHLLYKRQRKPSQSRFPNLRPLQKQSPKVNSSMNSEDSFRSIDPLVLALKAENEGGSDEVERGVVHLEEIEGTTTAETTEESPDAMIGEMIEGMIAEMIEGEMIAVETTEEMIGETTEDETTEEMTDDATTEGNDETMMTGVIEEEMIDMTEGGKKEDLENVLVLALLLMVADLMALPLIRKATLKADLRFLLLHKLPVTLKADSTVLHQAHFLTFLKAALMVLLTLKTDLMARHLINHMD